MSEGDEMRGQRTILTLNAGSSSLKATLFAADDLGVIWDVKQTISGDGSSDDGFAGALDDILGRVDPEHIVAVGHRVVSGGMRFAVPALIDEETRAAIVELGELAPSHQRAAVAIIDACRARQPAVPQVAAFDSSFHHTIPESNHRYAVPAEWLTEHGVRKIGYHGLSHAWVAERVPALLGRRPEDLRIVSCHLGSGSSLCALAHGRSVQTTMGLTPLDGVMMATRPGSLDPGAIIHLLRRGLTVDELDDALNHHSGITAIAGETTDPSDLIARRNSGDRAATLAIDMFVARVREGIAAMAASMGGLDAIAFTGGIGEHSPETRALVCDGLGWLGAHLDGALNRTARDDARLSLDASPVAILLVASREDLMIARATKSLVT